MEEATLTISQVLQAVIENAGINICNTYCQDGRFTTELEWWSDLGEDIIVTLWHDNNDESFIADLEEYYNDFDPEEHACVWYGCKDTVKGVPQSLKDLLEDAEDIKNTIWELLNKLKEAKKGSVA